MSDDLRGLDAWIEGDPPDPGSGDGIDHPMTMRCTVCAWHASGKPGQVFTAAIGHAESGHVITYRGTVQDLSRWVRKRAGAA